MAGDKDKKAEQTADKKSPIKALVLVAIGAALGGGGVVVLTEPPQVKKDRGPPASKMVVVKHPDEMKFVFNPVKERGSTTARIKFKFDYLVDEQWMDAAHESIKIRWDRANDRCISVLTQFTARELKTYEGKQAVRRRLVDELTMVFFPEELQPDRTKARVAVVDDVLWTEFFLQN